MLAHLRAQGPSIGAVGDLDGLLKGPEGIEKIGRVVGRQPVEGSPHARRRSTRCRRFARVLCELLLQRNHVKQFLEKLAMLVGELYARGLALLRNQVQKLIGVDFDHCERSHPDPTITQVRR